MSENLDELLSEAKNLANEKRFDESGKVFEKIFQSSLENPLVLRELALVVRDGGSPDIALSLLADSINVSAPDVPTLIQIATILRSQNRQEEAADILVCALAHDPENAELFEDTQLLLKQLGRESELQANSDASAPE